MSVLAGMACLDCVVLSPPMGDGGYLGAPSLRQAPVAVPEIAESLPTFAHLYAPLEAIGLRTSECEVFRDWLVRHDTHRVALYMDAEPPEVAEIGSDPNWKREYVLEERKRQDESDAAVAAGAFRDAIYRVRCSGCEAVFEAPQVERLRAFEAILVTSHTIDDLLARWTPIVTHDSPNAYRLLGLLDTHEPFLEQLLAFFRSHRGHTVQVDLVEGEEH